MKRKCYFLLGIAVLLLCNFTKGYSTVLLLNDHSYQVNNDTTIYNPPEVNAELPDLIHYFLTNNKYKDWKETDMKVVFIQGIVEIDGTITGVRVIRSSQNEDLDKEAIRLIQAGKYLPGKNRGKAVRSKITFPVYFPPQKQ